MLVLSAALTPYASATLVRGMTTADLVLASEVVVVARCTGKESLWVGRELLTRASFQVDEIVKGSVQPGITVLLPGGIDVQHQPPVQAIYAGAPEVQVGADVLLFLIPSRSTSGAYVVTGFSQGLFDLVQDGLESRSAARDLSQLILVSGAGARTPGRRESYAADALLREVRALVAAEFEGGR